MKKFFYILCFLVSLYSWGSQRTETIQLNFSAGDFQFTQIDGKTHISSNVHDLFFDESDTLPALPHIAINVLIGPNEQLDSLVFNFSNDTTWTNVQLPNCTLPSTTDSIIYKPSSQYNPCQMNYQYNVKFSSISEMDGYRYLTFDVMPFAYSGVLETLVLYKNLSLVVTIDTGQLGGDGNSIIFEPMPPGIVMREYIESIVSNNEQLPDFYGGTGNGTTLDSTSENQQPISYIIVTNNALKSVFQELANWKTIKGIKAKVLTTEDICTQYEGSTNQIKIKKALYDFYRGSNTGLKYVLLGGDTTIVPTMLCDVKAKSVNGMLYDRTPSDLFYASLKKIDWDSNNNGVYDTLDVKVDLTPDIIVTRAPISSISDASIFVNRIIGYEKSPNLTNWKNNIMLAGTMLHENKNDGLSDAHHNGQAIFRNHILGKWQCEVFRFFDTGTDTSDGADYDLTANNLQLELSKGYTFAHIETHGLPIYWAMERGRAYFDYDADSLHNCNSTVILTTACFTNAFDRTSCLSKSFIKNPDSGILAYYGSSRYGWNPTSSRLNGMFLRLLFNDKFHRFGVAAITAKKTFWGSDVQRWLELAVNPIGDPEMPIFLTRPKVFSRFSYSTNGHEFEVAGTGLNCFIAVSDINNNGESYCVKKELANPVTVFSGFPDSCNVCITQPNYIPFIAKLYKTAYIQNETIYSNNDIITENIFVGQSVTSEKEIGVVVFESGNNVIHCSNNALIASGVEVKKGAMLEIKNK